jgi:hypothetical protein
VIDLIIGLAEMVMFLVDLSRFMIRIAASPGETFARACRAIRRAPRWWWDG